MQASNFFYWDGTYQQQTSLQLDEVNSHHAVKVLRMGEGSPLWLTDGKGWLLTTKIAVAHPKRAVLAVEKADFQTTHRNYAFHLLIAPTKNIDRIEWMLEKTMEIGLDSVTFLQTQHGERAHINMERLRKIMVAALKQSMQCHLPLIHGPIALTDAVAHAQQWQCFVADMPVPPCPSLASCIGIEGQYGVFVGPEGGFSAEEFQLFQQSGIQRVSMGSNRLRTETAGLLACATVQVAHMVEANK